MSLPLSRNTNYTPGSPVKSADLNDLQDMIVGGRHGEQTVHIGASRFIVDNGSGVFSPGYLTAGGGSISYSALVIPTGTRIKTVTVYYNPNAPSGALQPRLQRMNPATGTINLMWTGTLDSSGNTIKSQTFSADHIMLATDVYWIECLHNLSSPRLYGAKLVIDRA